MTNIRELSNGIAELSEAAALLGGMPELKDDGSVMWCFPPHKDLPEGLTDAEKRRWAVVGGFSVSANTTEGELRALYSSMVSRVGAFVGSGRYGVDMNEFGPKIETFRRDPNSIKGMPGVDMAKALREYIAAMPNGEAKDNHMKLVVASYEQLKSLYDNNFIDENLKKAMNAVIENLENNEDFFVYFVEKA